MIFSIKRTARARMNWATSVNVVFLCEVNHYSYRMTSKLVKLFDHVKNIYIIYISSQLCVNTGCSKVVFQLNESPEKERSWRRVKCKILFLLERTEVRYEREVALVRFICQILWEFQNFTYSFSPSSSSPFFEPEPKKLLCGIDLLKWGKSKLKLSNVLSKL